jgi:hypothetical protein
MELPAAVRFECAYDHVSAEFQWCVLTPAHRAVQFAYLTGGINI